ncbi:unnamed protein product [Bemisia tabaci]|uniref:Uncharacterized protein n=1 Tax=Bemisia tabaci TaxID=7038 RepID=A0A9P0G4E2_BEMTA|nr:unnamed protein product [Bemisia tabaci]
MDFSIDFHGDSELVAKQLDPVNEDLFNSDSIVEKELQEAMESLADGTNAAADPVVDDVISSIPLPNGTDGLEDILSDEDYGVEPEETGKFSSEALASEAAEAPEEAGTSEEAVVEGYEENIPEEDTVQNDNGTDKALESEQEVHSEEKAEEGKSNLLEDSMLKEPIGELETEVANEPSLKKSPRSKKPKADKSADESNEESPQKVSPRARKKPGESDREQTDDDSKSESTSPKRVASKSKKGNVQKSGDESSIESPQKVSPRARKKPVKLASADESGEESSEQSPQKISQRVRKKPEKLEYEDSPKKSSRESDSPAKRGRPRKEITSESDKVSSDSDVPLSRKKKRALAGSDRESVSSSKTSSMLKSRNEKRKRTSGSETDDTTHSPVKKSSRLSNGRTRESSSPIQFLSPEEALEVSPVVQLGPKVEGTSASFNETAKRNGSISPPKPSATIKATKSKKSKSTSKEVELPLDKNDKLIEKLKGYVSMSGHRIQNYKNFWQDCPTRQMKINKLKKFLIEHGVKVEGRWNNKKVIKAIKKKKLADEVAALNCNVIISKGRSLRTRRSFWDLSEPEDRSLNSSSPPASEQKLMIGIDSVSNDSNLNIKRKKSSAMISSESSNSLTEKRQKKVVKKKREVSPEYSDEETLLSAASGSMKQGKAIYIDSDSESDTQVKRRLFVGGNNSNQSEEEAESEEVSIKRDTETEIESAQEGDKKLKSTKKTKRRNKPLECLAPKSQTKKNSDESEKMESKDSETRLNKKIKSNTSEKLEDSASDFDSGSESRMKSQKKSKVKRQSSKTVSKVLSNPNKQLNKVKKPNGTESCSESESSDSDSMPIAKMKPKKLGKKAESVDSDSDSMPIAKIKSKMLKAINSGSDFMSVAEVKTKKLKKRQEIIDSDSGLMHKAEIKLKKRTKKPKTIDNDSDSMSIAKIKAKKLETIDSASNTMSIKNKFKKLKKKSETIDTDSDSDSMSIAEIKSKKEKNIYSYSDSMSTADLKSRKLKKKPETVDSDSDSDSQSLAKIKSKKLNKKPEAFVVRPSAHSTAKAKVQHRKKKPKNNDSDSDVKSKKENSPMSTDSDSDSMSIADIRTKKLKKKPEVPAEDSDACDTSKVKAKEGRKEPRKSYINSDIKSNRKENATCSDSESDKESDFDSSQTSQSSRTKKRKRRKDLDSTLSDVEVKLTHIFTGEFETVSGTKNKSAENSLKKRRVEVTSDENCSTDKISADSKAHGKVDSAAKISPAKKFSHESDSKPKEDEEFRLQLEDTSEDTLSEACDTKSVVAALSTSCTKENRVRQSTPQKNRPKSKTEESSAKKQNVLHDVLSSKNIQDILHESFSEFDENGEELEDFET